MSTLRKPRESESEITKFKILWRDKLSEAERDYWRVQFNSKRPQLEIRRDLHASLGIQLNHDMQVTRFRLWAEDFAAIEEEKRKSADDLAELEKQGLSGEKLRDELLRRIKARALNHGDFKLGLKAIAADVKVETLQLGRERLQATFRTKIEAGLGELAKHIKGSAAARAAYEAFRNTVKEAAQ